MTQQSRIFNAKPMTEWLEAAQELPPLTPLYSPWWNEGENCFFFGSTGVGKTLYAMQMAHEISQEKKVLYFDFEMSNRQLLQRYNNDGELVPFSENLIRVEMHRDIFVYHRKMFQEIEKEVKKHDAQVVIIDNITGLLVEGQKAKHAAPFMQRVVNLKNKYNLSVLILAHTPKRKAMSQFVKGAVTTYDNPLELADMAGSAVLNNFIDSCFAISRSRKDKSLRYLKQLKSRSSEIIHGEDNVKVFELGQTEEGFLGLNYIEESPEAVHLQTPPPESRQERQRQAVQLSREGLSDREIARRLGVTHPTIANYLKNR